MKRLLAFLLIFAACSSPDPAPTYAPPPAHKHPPINGEPVTIVDTEPGNPCAPLLVTQGSHVFLVPVACDGREEPGDPAPDADLDAPHSSPATL